MDQMKEALLRAGINAPAISQGYQDTLVFYLKSRCSVGSKRIRNYMTWCLDQNLAVEYSPVFIACRAYQMLPDPEREIARKLHCSVSAARVLRRDWGIRVGGKDESESRVTLRKSGT